MRFTRVIGLAVFAAIASAAFVGVGSASAATLCKTNESPCSAGNTYGIGTTVKATLASGTRIKFKSGIDTIECSSSTIQFESTEIGGGGVPLPFKVTVETFGGCEAGQTLIVDSRGGLWAGATGGGTGLLHVEPTNELTITAGSLSCTYNQTVVGKGIELIGSATAPVAEATEALTELVKTRGSAACAAKMKVVAKYNITTPTSLFVVE